MNDLTNQKFITPGHIANLQKAIEQELAKYGNGDATDLSPVDVPVTHHHVPPTPGTPLTGVYAREAFFPKGSIIIGKVHKYEQLNIMSKGDVTLVTEGNSVRVQAPFTVVAPAGAQRAFLVHEDTIWTTIHGTGEQDVETIERMVVVDSYDKYVEFVSTQLVEDRS